jgi:hypothetical protein
MVLQLLTTALFPVTAVMEAKMSYDQRFIAATVTAAASSFPADVAPAGLA